ncbi:MAG: glycosyltransferase family 8 protein [Planctomycetota bacterium]
MTTGDLSSIHVAAAADSHGELPLAVMLDGLLRQMSPGRVVTLHVLDGGCDRVAIERVVGGRATVVWHDLAAAAGPIAGLPTVRHIPPISYARLLLPDVLSELDRVLYLDADMVIKADIAELWDTGTDSKAIAAVADPGMPTLGDDGCVGYASDELTNPAARPFNAGVMLMDLTCWRTQRFAERVIDFLRRHLSRLNWADQDGLNVVLQGDWAERNLEWNVPIPLLHGEEERDLTAVEPFDTDPPFGVPAIYHLFGGHKPWNSGPSHTFRAAWLEELRASRYVAPERWSAWRRRDDRRARMFSLRKRLRRFLPG